MHLTVISSAGGHVRGPATGGPGRLGLVLRGPYGQRCGAASPEGASAGGIFRSEPLALSCRGRPRSTTVPGIGCGFRRAATTRASSAPISAASSAHDAWAALSCPRPLRKFPPDGHLRVMPARRRIRSVTDEPDVHRPEGWQWLFPGLTASGSIPQTPRKCAPGADRTDLAWSWRSSEGAKGREWLGKVCTLRDPH